MCYNENVTDYKPVPAMKVTLVLIIRRKMNNYLLLSIFSLCLFLVGCDRVLSDSELIDIKTYSNIDEAQLYPNDVIKLSLSDKDIRYFPGKLLEFKNLHRLSLDGRGQLIIDEGILMYSKLQWIKISGYELVKFPDDISSLKYLNYISMSNCKLAIIPKGVFSNHNIERLDLDGNLIHSIPSSIGNLKSLFILALCDNPLDSLPDAFYELTELTKLNLKNTNITKIPASLRSKEYLSIYIDESDFDSIYLDSIKRESKIIINYP